MQRAINEASKTNGCSGGLSTSSLGADGLASRVRSANNVTAITRNLGRKLRVGKIENYA